MKLEPRRMAGDLIKTWKLAGGHYRALQLLEMR